MKQKHFFTLLLAVVFFLMTGLLGCQNDGPAEQAGEKVDQAVESTEEAVEEAGDEVEDTMEEAGEEIEDEVESEKTD